MSHSLDISVVMGVFNGGRKLGSTIESILHQEGVSLELILVNDGSTDSTRDLIQQYAKVDRRVKALHKERNEGLTRALRDGCVLAQAPLIARQDCGDVALPGRLSSQCSAFDRSPELAMLAGGVRFVVDEERVLQRRMTSGELSDGLGGKDIEAVFGPPHHGATMFRRDVYERVGGYRCEFYFAQDLDLWLRLAEVGEIASLEEIVYEAALDAKSISGRYRIEQQELKALALECRHARLRGDPEQPYLDQAKVIRPERRPSDESSGNYFIGRLLEPVNRERALSYYSRAISTNPYNWRAQIRRLQLRMKILTS